MKSRCFESSTAREPYRLCSSNAVKQWKHHIFFHRSILPGCAEKSYGIQVARLVGLPENLIARSPFDIETFELIEPPWQAIKQWIPADDDDLSFHLWDTRHSNESPWKPNSPPSPLHVQGQPDPLPKKSNFLAENSLPWNCRQLRISSETFGPCFVSSSSSVS